MSSGRFDCTKPSLATSLQGKQGVQGVGVGLERFSPWWVPLACALAGN